MSSCLINLATVAALLSQATFVAAFSSAAVPQASPSRLPVAAPSFVMLAKKKGGKRKKQIGKKGFGSPLSSPPSPLETSSAAPSPQKSPTVASNLAARVAAKAGAADLSQQHNLGMDLMAQQKYEEAGLAFEAVINVDPTAIDSWSALGICMKELGQTDAALVCQKQVMRLRSGSSATEFSQYFYKDDRTHRPPPRFRMAAATDFAATSCAPLLPLLEQEPV